jgi:hypothetical protein
MERLDGDVLRTDEPGQFAIPEYRLAVSERLDDTLAAIHAVEYEAIGLGEGKFEYPAGYSDGEPLASSYSSPASRLITPYQTPHSHRKATAHRNRRICGSVRGGSDRKSTHRYS